MHVGTVSIATNCQTRVNLRVQNLGSQTAYLSADPTLAPTEAYALGSGSTRTYGTYAGDLYAQSPYGTELRVSEAV